MIPIIGESTEVYIVLIDSKGVMLFQPFSLQRWAKAQAIYNSADKPEVSHVLFKIKLSETEANICKTTIKNNKFMATAGYLVQLKVNRGEVD